MAQHSRSEQTGEQQPVSLALPAKARLTPGSQTIPALHPQPPPYLSSVQPRTWQSQCVMQPAHCSAPHPLWFPNNPRTTPTAPPNLSSVQPRGRQSQCVTQPAHCSCVTRPGGRSHLRQGTEQQSTSESNASETEQPSMRNRRAKSKQQPRHTPRWAQSPAAGREEQRAAGRAMRQKQSNTA
jgi:hypothetical protein